MPVVDSKRMEWSDVSKVNQHRRKAYPPGRTHEQYAARKAKDRRCGVETHGSVRKAAAGHILSRSTTRKTRSTTRGGAGTAPFQYIRGTAQRA